MTSEKNFSKTSSKRHRWTRRVGGCLLIIVAIPLLHYLIYFMFRGPLPSDPQAIAHRGGPVYQPENTLAAFRNAINVGVDWIEMDVQRTKDGVLVVFHDDSVERTTNGVGRVENLTFDEIHILDAGNGEKVPTFQEVIALAKENGIGILPEVKSPHLYPGMAAEMVEEIIQSDYVEETVIQSFDHDTLEEILRINPAMKLCPLYGLWQLNLNNPSPKGASTLCPMAEMVILNPWMIKQAHAQGKEVYVWFGVIESKVITRLILAMGADGLMVDDPVALVEILGR
jgi:glycerophosphoryl diester phosphodiesterase